MEVLKKEFLYSDDKDYNIVLLFKNNHKQIGLYNSLEEEKIIVNGETTIEFNTLNTVKSTLGVINNNLYSNTLECKILLQKLIVSVGSKIPIVANQNRNDIKIQLEEIFSICQELVVLENKISVDIFEYNSKYNSLINNIKSNEIESLKVLVDNISLSSNEISNKLIFINGLINFIISNQPPIDFNNLKQNCDEYLLKSNERTVISKSAFENLKYLNITTLSYEAKILELTNEMKSDVNSEELTSTRFFVITGTTENRLNDVRGYDNEIPYKVGVNGVAVITSDYIGYKIDNIEYTTYYSGDLINLVPTKTIYRTQASRSYTNGIDNKSVNHFIYKDEKNSFIEKGKISNDIFLERNPIAVNDYFFRLNHINTADDFINYF